MSYIPLPDSEVPPGGVKDGHLVTRERANSTASEKMKLITMSTNQTGTPAPLENSSRRNHVDEPDRATCPTGELKINIDDVTNDMIIDDVDMESREFPVKLDDPPPEETLLVEEFNQQRTEMLKCISSCERIIDKVIDKPKIRSYLLELMRSNGGNVRVLEEIENGSMTAEALEQTYGEAAASTSRLERNVAFLWSAFMKRRDLVEVLLKCGADIDYCEPVEGFSALHLSAFSGCVNCLKFLISKGANVNYALRNYTPLHSAAFGNSVATAQLLINSGARTDIIGSDSDGVCGTAIHSAIKANSVECVQLLARYCSDINCIEPTGRAPIHVAADLDNSQCLQVILDVEGVDVNVKTKDKKNTALHLASESGNPDYIDTLLSRGAVPDIKNDSGQTALHLAAKEQSVECVETLLKKGRCDPNVLDNDQQTPLHCAVSYEALKIVEILVSSGADVNRMDKNGNTPLHIAALNELSQCVEYLINHGADVTVRSVSGMTALGLIVRKTPASLVMFEKIFDKAISMNDQEKSSINVKLKLDFKSLLQHCPNKGEISFLNELVEEGQEEILEHPLCKAFLVLKWNKISKFYFCKIAFSIIFVLLFTCYVFTALAHDWYNIGEEAQNSSDLKIINCKLVNCSLITNYSVAKHETGHTSAAPDNVNTRLAFGHEGDFTDTIGRIFVQSEKYAGANKCQNITGTCNSTDSDWQMCKIFTCHPEYIELQWFVLMVFAIIASVLESIGLTSVKNLRQYFTQYESLVEWFVIVSVFAISCVYTGKTYAWQNYVAAFAVLASWINVMFMFGQLPQLGTYVYMYSMVFKKFAKLLLAYVCLLFGFTISFCVAFPSEDKFANPFIAFISMLIMMTGAVDMDLLVKLNNSQWLFVSAIIIYVLFLLLVTVVLMNLLVGIAVNDIQELEKTAGLSKLVRKTQLINNIEQAMINGLLGRAGEIFFREYAMVFLNINNSKLEVRPHDPREQRLPKHLLKSAYDVVNRRRKRFSRQESEVTNVEAAVDERRYELDRLRGVVQEMKDMLEKNQIEMKSSMTNNQVEMKNSLTNNQVEMKTLFARNKADVQSLQNRSQVEMQRLQATNLDVMKDMLAKNQIEMQSLLEALIKKCSDC